MNQPRVRPYGAMLLFEGKIYIMAFGKTNATRQEVGRALIEKMPILKDALDENGENSRQHNGIYVIR